MNLRRAVSKLIFITVFLLIFAWVSLKLMQYKGDWQGVIRELQHSDAGQFVTRKVVPFFRDTVWPAIERLIQPVRDFVREHIK